MDVAHNLPKPSQWVLRRLETPVSVDAAATFFLGLTTGPDKAGVFCPHGRIPTFPQVYTGGPEEVTVLLCRCGQKTPGFSGPVVRPKKNVGATSTLTGVSSLLKTHCEGLGRFGAISMLTGAPSLLRSYVRLEENVGPRQP